MLVCVVCLRPCLSSSHVREVDDAVRVCDNQTYINLQSNLEGPIFRYITIRDFQYISKVEYQNIFEESFYAKDKGCKPRVMVHSFIVFIPSHVFLILDNILLFVFLTNQPCANNPKLCQPLYLHQKKDSILNVDCLANSRSLQTISPVLLYVIHT